MGKRKFEIGDWAVVNSRVPQHMVRYVGHRGQIVRVSSMYHDSLDDLIFYELRDCLESFEASELDKIEEPPEGHRA